MVTPLVELYGIYHKRRDPYAAITLLPLFAVSPSKFLGKKLEHKCEGIKNDLRSTYDDSFINSEKENHLGRKLGRIDL